MIKTNPTLGFVFFVCLVFLFICCEEVGDMRFETHSIKLDSLESAEIELDINNGRLNLQGGTRELMEGQFQYNVERWKPEIDFHTSGDRGILTIDQKSGSGTLSGRAQNQWDIDLNSRIPLNLVIDFGAGAGRLDCRNLNLRTLDIDMGVGDLILDLTGERQINLDVSIEGGVGHASVYLPDDIGIRVKVDGGIGSVHAGDMIKKGNVYTNSRYGRSDISIVIDIDAGIGSVDLILR